MTNELPSQEVLTFLKSFLSQWHRSYFTVEGVQFNCCEQYMMYRKAKLFNDSQMLDKILAATEPHDHKRLGQAVRGFEHDVWHEHRMEIAYTGNYAKFSQNAGLQKKLLATGDKILAEANPKDHIWGICLAEDNPDAQKPEMWQGQNLLGITLMKVRETIRNELAN